MAYQPKSYRKFLAGSVSAAVVASALVAPAASAASADFPDVPKGHWAYDAISTLTAKDIINGYTDGSFKPSQLLNRGQAAALFTNALGLEIPEKLDTFKDLKSTSYFAQYAAAVEAAGVFGGYADGNFGAGDNLTREQMASVLVRAFDFKATGDSVDLIDLDKAHASHRENIKILAQNGISVNEDKTFDPKDPVSRAHFATFLYRSMVATGMLAENPAVESVKAINATTVEVKFAGEVKDVESIDFSIDGLDVKNAAVKQTDNKTVVLTTAAQEGGKKYTVKADGENLGSFTGISAVTPEKINVVTNSLQGVVGKEVTVRAEVTVKDGQSKAGIPVTFNIDSAGTFNKDQVVEVYTNENGVAEYSYTQYSAGDDKVIAYATGNADIRATNGMVYWGVDERLTLSEVTSGNSFANGAKKVYKVKASTSETGGYVNVAFAENVNVTPDKGVTTVEVTDAYSNGTNGGDKYPYQYTTGGTDFIKIKLDSNGEATFTVSGKNASVTPIVFVDGSDYTTTNNKLASTELQATAPTVKFEGIQTFGLTLEAKGVSAAAAIEAGRGDGGREYKAVVTNKDGKLAPKGTPVKVVVKEANLSKSPANVYLVDSADSNKVKQSVVADTAITLLTDAKGEVSFTLVGNKNAFATPTVFLETGDKTGLDASDLQKDGEIVYFGSATVTNAKLTVLDGDGDEVTSVIGDGSTQAEFTYQSVDQNGMAYSTGTSFNTTFELTAGFSDVYYWDANGAKQTLAAGKTTSVVIPASSTTGEAKLFVAGNNVTSASVKASASTTTLPDQTASVAFTKYADALLVTGPVSNINDSTKELTVTESGKTYTYSYATGTYQIGGQEVTRAGFEAKLVSSEVTVAKAADGKLTFNIIDVGTAVPTAPTAPALSVGSYQGGDAVTISAVPAGTTAWLAPAGTTSFTAGTNMTSAAAAATSISAPADEGQYKLFLVDGYGRVVSSTNSITVDNTAPTTTITSATYTAGTDTLVLTGTDFSTAGTGDIKSQLDWAKLVWDINGDGSTTADVTFAASDIASATVSSDSTLTIVLTTAKGTALEGTTGFNLNGPSAADTLDVTAGFVKDAAGNAATTDAIANGLITIN